MTLFGAGFAKLIATVATVAGLGWALYTAVKPPPVSSSGRYSNSVKQAGEVQRLRDEHRISQLREETSRRNRNTRVPVEPRPPDPSALERLWRAVPKPRLPRLRVR